MSSAPREPLSPSQAQLADNLLAFYDEFVEFEGYCAFLCDGLAALTMAKTEMDTATLHGISMFSGEVKQRISKLKMSLRKIQQKSLQEL